MLPGTLLAGALLLSLVPGWLFLRLTESIRRPRRDSDLYELMELVAVGVGTTGLACLAAAIIRPAGIYDLGWPPQSSDDVRELGLSVLSILFLAGLLSCSGAAALKFRARKDSAVLATSVWWDIFRPDQVPQGHAPYVAVTLKEGRGVVEGILASYTWQSGTDERRDLALRKPIRYQAGRGADGKQQYRKPAYDRLLIDAEQIQEVALMYVPR